jgi:hypothetical protein
MVVVCVMPPPLPVIVMVSFPRGAFLLTKIVMVEVPEPGAAIGFGLKVATTGEAGPSPETDKLMAESKPPEIVVVIVEIPELPL